MQVIGLVTKINKKTKTNAGAPMKSPAYSMLLDDSTWYNMGFDAPTCQEGDVVSFSAAEDTYGLKGQFSTVKVQTGGADASPKVKSVVKAADNRQESIVFQSSLKTATDIVGHALNHECLVIPSKKADRLPALIAAVREVARELAQEAIAPDFASFVEPETEPENDE